MSEGSASNPDRTVLRCRWLFPGDGPPLANGVVEIESGRITAVHNRPGPALDLGTVALLPGLVNAHTHLEFSGLDHPIAPPRPFTTWIRNVVADRRVRRGDPAAPFDEIPAIAAGMAESLAAGVTTLGEITTSSAWENPKAISRVVCSLRERSLLAERADHPQAPRVIAFREIIGLLPERADEQLAMARQHLAAVGAGGDVIAGLSPHAPYSVHRDLLRRLVDLSLAHRAPVAMHLAETEAELELLAHGTGEFRTMLDEFGLWRDGLIPSGSRPLDYLHELARAERALVVHGNYLSDEECAFVASHPQLSVVYCPRTHAYFGHRAHPWRELLARGVNVALGTDSRASNPDLSLWREVLFLRQQFPKVEPRVLLQLATLNGAEALGQNDQTGTLEPGKAADIAVVSLPACEGAPWSLLFHPASQIIETM